MLRLHKRSVLAAARRVRHFSTGMPGTAIDSFAKRHLGPTGKDLEEMLKVVGFKTLDDLAGSVVPVNIRSVGAELRGVPPPATESEALIELKAIAGKNKVLRSFIGQGYSGTKTPSVIMRQMLENPGWYTAYTPYQAEISQGRLEMLLNFQTMVASITGMDISNCSLLDEGSSAAEAMNMCHAVSRGKRGKFFVSSDCHPQTIACVQTRGDHMGVQVVVGDINALGNPEEYSGVLVQYPTTFGDVQDYRQLANTVHDGKAKLVVATDLLACTVATPPGEWGADIVIGSSQRFGVPMFFGGPHAAYMAVQDSLKRMMPGRLIGVSVDSQGNPALRMALQTREQFIRREKATSNICTAQALLANVAAAYGIYHGPEGLKDIARSVHHATKAVSSAAKVLGLDHDNPTYFDTLTFTSEHTDAIIATAVDNGINLRKVSPGRFGVALDETVRSQDLERLVQALAAGNGVKDPAVIAKALEAVKTPQEGFAFENSRSSVFMPHPIFNKYHSETQMLRYLATLERRDVSLRESMIPLGSCTMKLNAASEMIPVSWPEFAEMHPFCPENQATGYHEMIGGLHSWLASLTGFAAMSSQPNSGATGEYAGLLCIKDFHTSNGQANRNICLIPNSAHGTNPASAVMAGMSVVGIQSDAEGNVDVEDLKKKIAKHSDNLAALMITYPSTYGKFETAIKEIIDLVHDNGGQVYMDGANMNAQLGLTSPGLIGADVCHLNLHKTFAIPHGGGGPGVGTIGVAKHLAPFLPGHVVLPQSGEGDNTRVKASGQVASSPFGSAGVLPIPWMFIRMMGNQGMIDTSRTAILNANYIAKKIEHKYKILYRGHNGQCAHEFIMDLHYLSKHGLSESDVAKRLADYGFHAPTMSWPVHHTLMIEPTESESKEECDRLVEALLSIHEEIQEVVDGKVDPKDNVLVNSPHTAEMVTAEIWNHPYSRKKAAFPLASITNASKFWPSVGRVDNVAGDRNLICSCPTVEELEI